MSLSMKRIAPQEKKVPIHSQGIARQTGQAKKSRPIRRKRRGSRAVNGAGNRRGNHGRFQP